MDVSKKSSALRAIDGKRPPRILGAVIRDKVDDDFGWIILMREPGEVFKCVDVECSYRTVELATTALHRRMEEGPPYPKK